MAVHVGHLKLVLEVRNGAQATEDDTRPAAARIVDQKPIEAVDLDAAGFEAHLLGRLVDHVHPLGHGEQRFLRLVVQDCHDDLLEGDETALQDGGVALRDRIKGPRIDGDASH